MNSKIPMLAPPWSVGLLALINTSSWAAPVAAPPFAVEVYKGEDYRVVAQGRFIGPNDQLVIARDITATWPELEWKRSDERGLGELQYTGEVILFVNGEPRYRFPNLDDNADWMRPDSRRVDPALAGQQRWEFDLVHFRSICLEPGDGQLVVEFSGHLDGGVHAGEPDTVVFVGYDRKTRRVTAHSVLLGHEWNGEGCLQEALAQQRRAPARERDRAALVNTLAPTPFNDETPAITPIAAGRGKLPVRLLKGDPRPRIRQHLRSYRSTYVQDRCVPFQDEPERADGGGCEVTRSGLTVLYDGPKLALYALHFVQDCASDGTWLLQDKASGRWWGLYRIPAGCSDQSLYDPKIVKVDDSEVIATFCTLCDSWGEEARLRVDLEDFKVSRVPDEDHQPGH